jgi:predicted PurR-regulated permease PerM
MAEPRLRDFGGGFLLACLLGGLIVVYIVFRPFLTILFIALVLATISSPPYLWILHRSKGHETISALFTCILVVILLIVPSLVLLTLLAKESLQVYSWVNEKVQAGLLSHDVMQQVIDLQERLVPQLDIKKMNLGQLLTEIAGKLSGLLVDWSAAALRGVTTTIWQFVLMLFALFYTLKDGGKLLHWFMHVTPLPGSLMEEIVSRFKAVSESAFYGTFCTALAQGFLGGTGFLIVGLPPFVWGAAMAFLSMVPVIGPFAVWIPAAVLLISSGRVGAGVFLILWGIVVVGLTDNFLRPYLMRGKSRLHPVLIFFAILGGIAAFGPLGILAGPLAVVLVTALFQAYEEAARPFLDELDRR